MMMMTIMTMIVICMSKRCTKSMTPHLLEEVQHQNYCYGDGGYDDCLQMETMHKESNNAFAGRSPFTVVMAFVQILKECTYTFSRQTLNCRGKLLIFFSIAEGSCIGPKWPTVGPFGPP